MLILGLDPGLARTGYGVIDTKQPQPFVRCGCLTTPSTIDIPLRLSQLSDQLTALIDEVNPDQAAVEDVFFGRNVSTAMLTAQARGVLLSVLAKHRIPVTSLTPLQIKHRIAGHGYARKKEVQQAVAERLNLADLPESDDAADALAAALCQWAPKEKSRGDPA